MRCHGQSVRCAALDRHVISGTELVNTQELFRWHRMSVRPGYIGT